MIEGFDVSEHQPPGAVKLDEVAFLLARVTMGVGGIDKYGWAHLHDAAKVGVPLRIAYHFLRGDSPGSAQAKRFLDRVAMLDESIGPVGLMVDVENADGAAPWHVPTYRGILLDFLAHVRSWTARRALIYGSGAYLPLLELPAEVAALHPLMLADWSPPYPVPKPWRILTIHQYEVTVINGIKVDRDRYDGSVEGLRQELGLTSGADELAGKVAGAVRCAEGRGEGAEDFMFIDEGPVIEG